MHQNEMFSQTKVKTRRKLRTATAASGRAAETRQALGVLGLASASIGIWAVACLVSAMATQGGVVGLIRGWVTAVAGV